MSAPAAALTALREKFPRVTERASADHPAADVPAEELLAVLRCLRDEHGYDLLADLTAVDWAEEIGRAHV